MTDYLGQFIRTGDVTIATNFGIGVIAYLVAFSAIRSVFNGRDGRFFVIGAAALAVLLYAVNRDMFVIFGMALRAFFLGSMPAIGWISFGVMVLIAGAAIGIHFARNYSATRHIGEPAAEIAAEIIERPEVQKVCKKPLPNEPVRLIRTHTPPVVPVEYRREHVPAITDRRR